jgi:hypothetical protein
MPSFPSRDFTNQYISRSYQDVVQQYIDGGPTDYLLDGYGNVIFSFDSASYGAKLITTRRDKFNCCNKFVIRKERIMVRFQFECFICTWKSIY